MKLLPLFLLPALVVACDSRPGTQPNAPAQTKIQILSTIHPLADIARRVGGTLVDVQSIVEGPQRPDQLTPDADTRQRASRAQLVITSGPWDAWASEQFSADARDVRIIEPERTRSAPRDLNPKTYLWLDPLVVKDMAEDTRFKLTVIDPAHDAAFKQTAQSLNAELDALDKEIRATLAPFAGKKLLTVRPVWSAFCARYGLTELTPVDSTEDRLTAADFREITKSAKANQIRTIFVDAATPAPVRQQIAEKTGLRVVTLDPIGTSAPDGLSTYAKLMRFNASQIKSGLE